MYNYNNLSFKKALKVMAIDLEVASHRKFLINQCLISYAVCILTILFSDIFVKKYLIKYNWLTKYLVTKIYLLMY
jgi:hypothetical protein